MSLKYIVKNCGNFSKTVLAGMIAYGRETKSKDDDFQPNPNLPPSDGYATKEHDIQLGGFLYRQCSREVSLSGRHLSELTVDETQRVALKVSRQHIEKHGGSGLENYQHWLKRVSSLARKRKVVLSPRVHSESAYAYSRRLRKCLQESPEKWPEMEKAVGTHLVFSPEPKLWPSLRGCGLDERLFLKEVLSATMKEFQDWRRKELGPGHSLGWVAGTHVHMNGADRHPHIHVVVLKRDESGRSTDWSVSNLKGRSGRENEPDPMLKIKTIFQKQTEKAFERYVGKSPEMALQQEKTLPREQSKTSQWRHPKVRQIARLARIVLPHNLQRKPQTELGALIRLARILRREERFRMPFKEQAPNLTMLIERIKAGRSRQKEKDSPSADFEPELEP